MQSAIHSQAEQSRGSAWPCLLADPLNWKQPWRRPPGSSLCRSPVTRNRAQRRLHQLWGVLSGPTAFKAMFPTGWAVKLLLSLMLLPMGYAEETPNIKDSCQPQPSCHACIRSHLSCAWCKQLDFVQPGESETRRCASRVKLERRGCLPSEIVDPRSEKHILEDRPLSNRTQPQKTITQLVPQRVSLYLRLEEEQSFKVSFKRAEGYPVDLYYLMDLSYSMKDDLKNIKRLGSDLLAALRDVTTSVRIGFGSFVDKTVVPYVSIASSTWKNPCLPLKETCQSPFSYHHVLPLTDNASEFESRVSQQQISGNLDNAEGGFDAIMQAAVCKEQIGWRNVTRLLVFTSDGAFHMAGDGKLGGIYMPNDGQCHLDAQGRYTKSHLYDYPSVGHLAEVLSNSNIQPIFAVTDLMLPMYEELSKFIPKSVVGELKDDSSNVVQLIAEAYSSLSSTVNLEHSSDLPPGISIAYDSHCGDSETYGNRNSGECLGVHVNQLVEFTVRIKASLCLPEPRKLIFRVPGVGEELQVELTTVCECQCEDAQTDADHCSGGHGNLTCGVCRCQEGYVGQLCECKPEMFDPEASCGDVNDAGLGCRAKGQCVCGKCQCNSPLCGCDNNSCERHNGQLCAGNGQCSCGRCECHANYTGSACECSLDTSGCMQDGAVCSGHGQCVCSRCQCDAGWFDSHCSHCADCRTPCEEHRDCAECKAFGTGPLSGNCSTSCNQTVEVSLAFHVDETWCQTTAEDGTLFRYHVEKDEAGRVTLMVNSEEGTSQQIFMWVLGSVLGLVFAGLLLIVGYRVTVEIYDRKEFRRFEKECKEAEWKQVNNPLFRSATTTITNPKYSN